MVLGRPKSKKSSPDKYKLSEKKMLIMELLAIKVSKRKVAKISKVDRKTLDRFLKEQVAE